MKTVGNYKVKFLKDTGIYKKDSIHILTASNRDQWRLDVEIGQNYFDSFIIGRDIEIIECPKGKNWRQID